MKVILAGISKTGTKSMAHALKELGFNVHDYLEHYLYNGDDWIEICTTGGGAIIEKLRKMYDGVDAVVDLPVWYFWEELHEAFPEAKIILTIRESEDQWFQSIKAQHQTFQTPIVYMMYYLSPSYRKFYQYGSLMGVSAYGFQNYSLFKIDDLNEMLLKMVYRRHNAYVLETAPKEKLLEYNVKEEWEPLCKFLGVDVPSTPFPHKNVRGKITEEMMKTNPFFIRMQREMYVSCLLIAVTLSYGCYKLFKSPPKSSPEKLYAFASNILSSTVSYFNWK